MIGLPPSKNTWQFNQAVVHAAIVRPSLCPCITNQYTPETIVTYYFTITHKDWGVMSCYSRLHLDVALVISFMLLTKECDNFEETLIMALSRVVQVCKEYPVPYFVVYLQASSPE